ncbi:hypothetical protein DMC61_00765 [Amycolatopsis sp. WAC 04169]|uniref:hypothetical protein n=1 Tax=Amycolatopsis sp. WAC 04169 TaxID=2203197 RepID=UPI000F7B4FB7|nr:hypothetical protein [Amycolatopsis sp. WAC 04169]RSN36654.1 hypothetical protein DMC61_00765 [Amycolatopsis sp. WAC 04169]
MGKLDHQRPAFEMVSVSRPRPSSPQRDLLQQAKQLIEKDDRLSWLKRRPADQALDVATIFVLAERTEFAMDFDVILEITQIAHRIGVDDGDRREGAGVLDAVELLVENPDDVSKVVQLAMSRARLGHGQIAARTGINRSQVYNLSKQDGALPREPDQLLKCLHACKMPTIQIDLVIMQWRLLRERRRRGLSLELPRSPIPAQRHESFPPVVQIGEDRGAAEDQPAEQEGRADNPPSGFPELPLVGVPVGAPGSSRARQLALRLKEGVRGRIMMIAMLVILILMLFLLAADDLLPSDTMAALPVFSMVIAGGSLVSTYVVIRTMRQERDDQAGAGRARRSSLSEMELGTDYDDQKVAVRSTDGVYMPRLAG